MKTVYICGDSFGVSDPKYGAAWMDLLGQRHSIVNLATVAASNLMISLQVDQAISAEPDYIIMLATSCTRGEIVREAADSLLKRITPYSILSINSLTTINEQQREFLKRYHNEFFDLDLAIYKNQCIIENTLHKLTASGIPFSFDQGGFEHRSYGGNKEYFGTFNKYRSAINLWDHAPQRTFRPYYHVTDPGVHQLAAEYYDRAIDQA